jgi:hypothetical protein
MIWRAAAPEVSALITRMAAAGMALRRIADELNPGSTSSPARGKGRV